MFKLTVITVTYNAGKVIEKCLKSVISEKNREVEYVVVDGLSSDETVSLIKAHESSIDQFVSEKDKGIYNAMNKAWCMARGEFVIFINADDTLNPGSIETILKEMRSHPHSEILFFPVSLLSTDGRSLGFFYPKIDSKVHDYYSVPSCHQGTVMKKSVLEKFAGFDESFRTIADFDLVVSALKSGIQFSTLETPVATFRLGGASANPVRYEGELRRLYKKHSYYNFAAELFLIYVRASITIQKKMPKRMVKLIKRLKKSKFADFEV